MHEVTLDYRRTAPVRVQTCGPVWTAECDLVVLPVFADGSVPDVTAAAGAHWRFAPGAVATRLGLRESGDLCTVALSGNDAGPDLLLVCVADAAAQVSADLLRRAAQRTGRALIQRRVACALAEVVVPGTETAALVADALLVGAYSYSGYREPGPRVETILISGVTESDLVTARVSAEAANFTRDLVNCPPADLTPSALAEVATAVARAYGLPYEVLDREALESGGFGGIAAVGRGSEHGPVLVTIDLVTGPGPVTALIGKGITFDSGGIQIKASAAMQTMKYDMAGAATGLATVRALCELVTPANVRLYLACAENAPDGRSYRPSDVIRHRAGRTTEIMSTDAEGRLVLADAIDYAIERGADEIITVSTLTGGTGLGPGLWGMLGTDDTLLAQLLRAGVRCGDQGWILPLWQDYAPMLQSPVADSRNYDFAWPGSAIAGAPPAILGAMFLKPFVGQRRWAHLDMAAAAWQVEGDATWPQGATGRPTRALVEHFRSRAIAP